MTDLTARLNWINWDNLGINPNLRNFSNILAQFSANSSQTHELPSDSATFVHHSSHHSHHHHHYHPYSQAKH